MKMRAASASKTRSQSGGVSQLLLLRNVRSSGQGLRKPRVKRRLVQRQPSEVPAKMELTEPQCLPDYFPCVTADVTSQVATELPKSLNLVTLEELAEQLFCSAKDADLPVSSPEEEMQQLMVPTPALKRETALTVREFSLPILREEARRATPAKQQDFAPALVESCALLFRATPDQIPPNVCNELSSMLATGNSFSFLKFMTPRPMVHLAAI